MTHPLRTSRVGAIDQAIRVAIPTYSPLDQGALRPQFCARAPPAALALSAARAGHNQIFLPHERSPFESAPAGRPAGSRIPKTLSILYVYNDIISIFATID